MRAVVLAGLAAGLIGLVGLVCVDAGEASAQTAPAGPGASGVREEAGNASKAAAEFAEGQRAFAAKDFPRAAVAFEAAYRDKPHYAPLWNAARSWLRAGEDVRAANLYAKYLREAPGDAPDRDQATANLRELAGKLARIETHADKDVLHVKVDGRELDDPSVYVAPGEHTAEGDAKGTRVAKTVNAIAGQTVSVALVSPAITPLVVVPPPRKEEASRKPLPPALAFVGAGLVLVGGGLTVASGIDTVNRKHDFLDTPGDSGRLDDAFASQTRTNVALGTTVGLAVLTGVVAIFFTDWSAP